MTNSRKAFLAVFIAALIGGGVPVFVKIAVREIPPSTFTLLRFFIAALFLLPFLFKKGVHVGKKDVLKLVGLSLFATANVILFAYGISRTAAGIAQVLYVCVPIIATFLSFLFLKESFSIKKFLGVISGLIGAAIIIFIPILDKNMLVHQTLAGNVIILAAVLSFSFYTTLSVKFQKQHSPYVITAFFTLTTVFVTFLFSLSDFGMNPWWKTVHSVAIYALIYVGIVGTAIYYFLYQYAVKKGGAIVAAMTLYLQPIASVIWAYFLLQERVTVSFVVGSVFVFAGAWVVINIAK